MKRYGGWNALLAAVMLSCFILPSMLNAQNGVSLLGQLDERHGGPGPSFGFYYASCWGYVAPDGHEYALIGTYSGTSIVDLDATPIREVAYIPGANSEWKEIKTWGQYAYCVSEGNQGVQIINLSQLPDTAWLVRSVTSVGGRNVSRNHTVTVADGYLYLNGSTAGGQTGGAIILSLADPENPTYVGQYQPVYLHDTYVRNDTLYGAAIYSGGGVYIASLHDKANPQTIGRITYPGSGTHNTWVSVDGRYVFTSDEVGSTQKNMKVFEVLQYNPTFEFSQKTPFTPNPSSIIHNIHGRGNYVYIAHYNAGVYVADVTDPLNIVKVGEYDTYTGSGTGYVGCWGVYPYFPSGRWIASDTQTGLYVFTFDGLAPRTRPSHIAPADGSTLSLVPFTEFKWTSAAPQQDDPHYYHLRIWGAGFDTLITTTDTMHLVSEMPGLQSNQTYSWMVWVKDEFTAVMGVDTFQFFYSPLSDVDDNPLTAHTFDLGQNYPNPFNPTTTIRFVVPSGEGRTAATSLRVYDVLGREMAVLVDGALLPGSHQVSFDASGLPSGVYLYRLSAGNMTRTNRMILMK